MVRFVVLAVLPLLVAACGGKWEAADAKSVSDTARGEAMALTLCSGDGGACEASQIRALDRSNYCNTASVLARHGEPVPPAPAGVKCLP